MQLILPFRKVHQLIGRQSAFLLRRNVYLDLPIITARIVQTSQQLNNSRQINFILSKNASGLLSFCKVGSPIYISFYLLRMKNSD